MITLAEVNAMPVAAFVDRFGGVAEHAPWVAERASRHRPFTGLEAMIAAFQAEIRSAADAERLSLIAAHPDLAGRAAMADGLTKELRAEQASAGVDRLSAEEFARFTDLNDRYRARFGIPFIFAVKGADKHQILASFAARIDNDRATEHANAIEQVCRIVGFRISDQVAP